MDLRIISEKEKAQYNKLVTHPLQSWQWEEFRKSLGTKLLRYGLYQNNELTKAFQLTFHKIPLTNLFVGYLPKGPFPDQQLLQALKKIGQENNCAFIKIEPNIEKIPNSKFQIPNSFIKSPKPLFTKFNFVLDLTKSEEEILKNMHPKFRYNIKVAQKHEVKIIEGADDQILEDHLKLYFATTKRQEYLGHNEKYHRQVFHILKENKMVRILIAHYNNIPLASWMLINFKDTLYYPYGGSFNEFRNVMASNLVAWEAIKLGKKLKLKNFDLWGAADPNKGAKDPYFGFTHFKSGMGAKLVEYLGTYDLVFNWPVYLLFTLIDRAMPIKIFLLKLAGKS